MSLINDQEKPRLRLLGKRTKVIERRIRSLLRRSKPFYLTTLSIEDNETIEEWYIDSGGWVSIQGRESGNYKTLGHIKNCLEFLDGGQPMWYDPTRSIKRGYVRRNVQRGTGF